MDRIVDISILMLFAFVLVDRIMQLLRDRGVDLQSIARKIDDLHEWHAVKDSNGVFAWYNKPSHAKDLDRLIRQQEVILRCLTEAAQCLKHVSQQLSQISEEVRRIMDRVEEVRARTFRAD